ncbi:hypothetical protein B0H10DRAFT_1954230 [Mycena sp. CBHHK59/15]|nr:hypothetical protein B0H10DRAFT_1954230 [Mycena sp. CBHHK59/15]
MSVEPTRDRTYSVESSGEWVHQQETESATENRLARGVGAWDLDKTPQRAVYENEMEGKQELPEPTLTGLHPGSTRVGHTTNARGEEAGIMQCEEPVVCFGVHPSLCTMKEEDTCAPGLTREWRTEILMQTVWGAHQVGTQIEALAREMGLVQDESPHDAVGRAEIGGEACSGTAVMQGVRCEQQGRQAQLDGVGWNTM